MQGIILALDVGTQREAERFISELSGKLWGFKIGHQLFTACGHKVVERIVSSGSNVFLDLKYHDIPNTVFNACREASRLGVSMINVHASGGGEMMEAALEGAREGTTAGDPPLVVAVTMLTSLSDGDLKDLGISNSVDDQVKTLALLAKQSGLDGVVCSPQELKIIREACGTEFRTVTPGIRPVWSTKDDQKRITTPREAVEMGSDYLVIGRPIRNADNPSEAVKKIEEEIRGS